MVVNNWYVTVNQYVFVMGEKSVTWVHFYFVTFWMFIVLI